MTYDESCNAVIKLAHDHGYKAINIDYDSQKRGPGHYSVSAKNPDQVRVYLAYASSYAGMVAEVRDYFLS